jgi:hypothetical protein
VLGRAYAADFVPPGILEVEKHKQFYDDPRPYLKDFGPKQVLPKDFYSSLVFDVEQMKKGWAEVVGFKAPDEVGKIAPEIKPGKYTYKDLEKYPGFKRLMYPDLYKRIKPGGPPMAGSIPEFEIIPTRQYYWSQPIIDMTKENLNKVKLDGKGYLVVDSWTGGYPFPRPSGRFKAQQVMYNIEKRYLGFGKDMYMIARVNGFTKDLKADFKSIVETKTLNLAGRAILPPKGFLDERAKNRGESWTYALDFQAPRDVAGTVLTGLFYLDPNKADNLLIYLPHLRRVRKMTSSDTQDPVMGQDMIYDDAEGFFQKASATKYPYKYEVVEEREYLVPAPTIDGAEYFSSKGMECRNVRMERRPMYVVKLTQLDKSYVYGSRLFYIDKETFLFYHVENFDQKGRLYRTFDNNYGFFPEMGAFGWGGGLLLMRDHVDIHSSIQQPYQLPVVHKRGDVSIDGLMKLKAK